MLDFPDPFGPVMAVKPGRNGTIILWPKDLKFSNWTSLRYIRPIPTDSNNEQVVYKSVDILKNRRESTIAINEPHGYVIKPNKKDFAIDADELLVNG
jgi:hypothetical protein